MSSRASCVSCRRLLLQSGNLAIRQKRLSDFASLLRHAGGWEGLFSAISVLSPMSIGEHHYRRHSRAVVWDSRENHPRIVSARDGSGVFCSASVCSFGALEFSGE